MHARRDADVIDVGLLFEIEMDALYVFDFEVAFPKRSGIDAIAENGATADFSPDTSQAFDRKPQAIFIRAAPAISSLVIERRKELPRQITMGEM